HHHGADRAQQRADDQGAEQGIGDEFVEQYRRQVTVSGQGGQTFAQPGIECAHASPRCRRYSASMASVAPLATSLPSMMLTSCAMRATWARSWLIHSTVAPLAWTEAMSVSKRRAPSSSRLVMGSSST